MNLIKTLLVNIGIIIIFIPFIYHGLPILAKQITLSRIKASINANESDKQIFNNKIRVVETESVENGSGIGSNIYLSLWYDCRETDLSIEGIIPEMQHWSIVPYDIGTSYPLNTWVEKDSIRIDEMGKYTVKLSSNNNNKNNFLNVAEAPVGLLLFRYTNPKDPIKAISNLPTVKQINDKT